MKKIVRFTINLLALTQTQGTKATNQANLASCPVSKPTVYSLATGPAYQ